MKARQHYRNKSTVTVNEQLLRSLVKITRPDLAKNRKRMKTLYHNMEIQYSNRATNYAVFIAVI